MAGEPIKKGSKIDLLVGKKDNDYISNSSDSLATEPD